MEYSAGLLVIDTFNDKTRGVSNGAQQNYAPR